MAQDVNHVILIGRLTRDAEMKYTSGGMAVCRFSIAVNRRAKEGDSWVDEANFFDIVVWGKTAEALNQYLVKGKQVAVKGELHQNRWEQDGKARSKVEINAETVQLLGGGENHAESTGNVSGGYSPRQGGQNASAAPSRASGSGYSQRPQAASQLPDEVPEDWTF